MAKVHERLSTIPTVLSNKSYLAAFLMLFIILFVAYSYLLLGSSLNLETPRVLFGLNVLALMVSVLVSALLSLSIIMNMFANFNCSASGMKLSAASVVAGIIPLSLCCTSIIPGILALFGASTLTIIGITGKIQGPFATYESVFILMSVGLLLLSISLASKNILKCRIADKHEN